MKQVDKNEAPEGYYAVESNEFNCFGCAFEDNFNFNNRCNGANCIRQARQDGCLVIFKAKDATK